MTDPEPYGSITAMEYERLRRRRLLTCEDDAHYMRANYEEARPRWICVGCGEIREFRT